MTNASEPPVGMTVGAVGVKEDAPNENAIYINSLQYSFPNGQPFINDFSLELPAGSRCLLAGANGAGKSTLLQVLAGKFMIKKEQISVLGRPPFHDTALTCNGEMQYLGGSWRRDVAFAGDSPLQGDFTAGEMLHNVKNVDPARRDHLIKLLDIDLNWSMIRTSDGQRRRVQIAMGLLREYKVLLMDEITVDLDVLSRLDLLEFFRQECEERGATIVYATHIFDGMETWATHLAYVESGVLKRGGPCETISSLNEGKRLLDVMTVWLREDQKIRKERGLTEAGGGALPAKAFSPYMPSKHMAFFR